MTDQEKAKREIMKQLHGLSTYQQVIAGRVYDAAYENGKADGARGAYTQGFKDANHYGSKVMIACACKALHEAYGFGHDRMQRFADAFRDLLLNTFDAHEIIQETADRYGIVFDDPVFDGDDDD